MNKKEKIICWIIVFRPMLLVLSSILAFFIVNHIVIKVWHTNELFELSYFETMILQSIIAIITVLFCVWVLLLFIAFVIGFAFCLKKVRKYLNTRYRETVNSRKKQKDRY